MFFLALATDYDGTLATEGVTDIATIAAVERLKHSGRRAILVTGRELPDLHTVFPHLDLFDLVVAENGGLLYRPEGKKEVLLAPPPPDALVARLREAGVPVSVGRTIVATWVPHDRAVLDAIRDLGLELKITYNKGAVMVLPAGVTKASGLDAALRELALSPRNVVGVGDAENDQAFLALSGCAVAVANALPSVKKEVDWLTDGARGLGVQQLIERMLATDLRDISLRRVANIVLGDTEDGGSLTAPWRGGRILIAGTSGGGKTTALTAILEQLRDRSLQTVVLDPEAEYEDIPGLVSLGNAQSPPAIPTALQLISDVSTSMALNLLAVPLGDRPDFLAQIIPQLDELRRTTGRPHWLVFDEVHHLLPAEWHHAKAALPQDDVGLIMLTTEPRLLAAEALASVEIVVAVGRTAAEVIAQVAEAHQLTMPTLPAGKPSRGEAIVWFPSPGMIQRVALPRSHAHHRRHVRKYVEGHLGPDVSFYFRGPENKMNLRADNLQIFLQMAEGIDDRTWLHHLRAGDYSRWFDADIKNPDLAAEAQAIEMDATLDAMQSRERIRAAIERRYVVSGGPSVAPAPTET